MKKVFKYGFMSTLMSGPRVFVALLGTLIIIGGIVTAVTFDKLIGIALVLVGGFLISLPLSRPSD